MNILVKAKAIMTMNGEGLGLLENASIYVEDGEIVSVGEDKEVLRVGNKSDFYFDLRDSGLVMPGFIDAHMHTPISIIRGFSQDVPEIEWMMRTVSPIVKYAEQKHLIAGSKLAVLEALKGGTTTFGDYNSMIESLISEIYLRYELRSVLTYTINALSRSMSDIPLDELYPFDIDHGYKLFDEGVRIFKLHESHPLIDFMLGPQALDMVPLELLRDIFRFADENGLMVHMHVAQGGRERKQIIKRYGKSTVELMNEENFLKPNLLAAHCHDTDDKELQLLSKNDVRMVSCQRAISIIDGVIPPLGKYLKLGGSAALGTDQACGNNNQSIFSELKFVSILNKILLRDPSTLPAWRVLRLATCEAAKVLGLRNVGRLVKGFRGDFIVIDLNRYNFIPVLSYPIRNYIFNLVYSSLGNEVTHVFIDGRPKVVNGEVICMKEDDVIKEAQLMGEDLLNKGGEEYLKSKNFIVKNHCKGLF